MKIRVPRLVAACVAVASLCFGAFTAPLTAGVIIDSFDSIAAPNPWPVELNDEGIQTVFESGLSVLGGTRQTHIEVFAVGIPGVDFVSVNIAAGAGLFDYNSTVEADGSVSLLYNAGGAGLNANLQSQFGIAIEFTEFDFAGQVPMPVSITISDGTSEATHTLSLTPFGPHTLTFTFADFANFGQIDLASVQSVLVEFHPAIGVDFRIAQIMTVVPAPGAFALLGLAGLIGFRRRR
jgi:hypothetical protein